MMCNTCMECIHKEVCDMEGMHDGLVCDYKIDLPKTGHWIEVTNGRGGHECDNCGEYAPSYQSGDEWLTKFCPNCGARMGVIK